METLIPSLYVDDVTAVVDSVQEGFSFFRKSRSKMKEGGLLLRNRTTTSDDLARLLSLEEPQSITAGNDSQIFAGY